MASFLDLPGEVREHIYSYTAEWIDVEIWKIRERISNPSWRTEDDLLHNETAIVCRALYIEARLPIFITPAILLLNRQIHDESKGFLQRKPLALNRFDADPIVTFAGAFYKNCFLSRFDHETKLAKVLHVEQDERKWKSIIYQEITKDPGSEGEKWRALIRGRKILARECPGLPDFLQSDADQYGSRSANKLIGSTKRKVKLGGLALDES
ncbi:MAG: hypothetical protein M1821_005102 [Bathelium mastoideum]|nr:MAG: hypothetical protein M1821_005102 [Bathelium mastoideum]